MLSNEMTSIILKILSKEGCKECYLFGSHVTGSSNENSDLDIGIKGLPHQRFFTVHSALEDATHKTVDLIDFDDNPRFFNLLRDLGELKKIE